MVECVPDSNYDQLQHFISNSPWDFFAVMDMVAEKVAKTLSLRADGTPCTDSIGLLLDESGWEKSGKKVWALLANISDKWAKWQMIK
jgi:SRSO17 transposase